MKTVTSKVPKPDMKRAMPFIQEMKRRLDSKDEPVEQVFDRKLQFDEVEVLKNMVPYLKTTVKKCVVVDVVKVEDVDGKKKGTVVDGDGVGTEVANLPPNAEAAVPGKPAYLFANV